MPQSQPRQRFAASGFCAVLAELCLLGPTGVVPSSCWELFGRILDWLWTRDILVQEQVLNMSRIKLRVDERGVQRSRGSLQVILAIGSSFTSQLGRRGLKHTETLQIPVTSHFRYNVPL